MTTLFKSSRGEDILVDDMQYMYNQNRTNLDGSVIYWECSRRKQLACKARVQTRCKSESYEIIQFTEKHNHSASNAIVDARSAVSKL